LPSESLQGKRSGPGPLALDREPLGGSPGETGEGSVHGPGSDGKRTKRKMKASGDHSRSAGSVPAAVCVPTCHGKSFPTEGARTRKLISEPVSWSAGGLSEASRHQTAVTNRRQPADHCEVQFFQVQKE
jgi:hypothetical protein